ncbi:unnamed protein product [Medioppia subpectinata]|uniref:Receptor expression-enhancing protein n=1 Tax=Medioppia subpectinata TaxID=1979941 RepID=A0A7R9KNM6_9ACAR|nr:unnamed protein product [Medioppia subpectinata]CAG2105759.1 unnamed protein product [Medioppia subpectinata]
MYRLLFGTLFPAYSSYKAVKNRDVREYSRWMMYWIVFAIFSFVEVFTDIFVGFWLPFYYEMKILFILWLMSPYGNGSKILYLHLIHPQLTSHEQTQAVVLNQMQRNASAVDGPPVQTIQTQQLLSQPNFLQQLLFMRSPKPNETESSSVTQTVQRCSSESITTSPNPISQRWFSDMNISEMNEEFKPLPHSLSLRMRSESESNLDDWEQMDVNEVDAKPPQPPSKGRKKTKKVSVSPSDKPVRRTARAAALRARAKCKDDSLPEEY